MQSQSPKRIPWWKTRICLEVAERTILVVMAVAMFYCAGFAPLSVWARWPIFAFLLLTCFALGNFLENYKERGHHLANTLDRHVTPDRTQLEDGGTEGE